MDHFTVRRGLICETKLPMQELELKMKGGLMREGGGVIAGFYGITTAKLKSNSVMYRETRAP